jgi:hypothetical protein
LPRTKLRLQDWLFGAGGKRRLLRALIDDENREWTEAELSRAASLHAKGSVDIHVSALLQLGILTQAGLVYRLVPDHPLIEPLRRVLVVLEAIEDAELKHRPFASVPSAGRRRPDTSRARRSPRA